MSTKNNTLKMKENQYHHLTEKDRTTIQTLIEQKDKNGKRLFNNSYIANYLGVHRSTISRELKKRKSYRFMVRSGKMIENHIMPLMHIKTIYLNVDYLKVNINYENILRWLNLLKIKLKLISGLLTLMLVI